MAAGIVVPMASSKRLRTGAALSFSLGSVLLIAEMTIALVVREEELTSGILVPTGWTIIGILGIVGWLTGGILLLLMKFSGSESAKYDRHNVFLAGRRSFRCRACKRTLDASSVGYHEKVQCRCGMTYNVFQEMETATKER